MAGGGRIALLNQMSSDGKRSQLAPHPSQHPPDGAMVECSFVNASLVGRCHVAGDSPTGTSRSPIRLPVLLDVSSGQRE
jgi:hypothetical protein